ncbi:MAG: DinB family protein [Anaerolineales bacterium]|nr:DinB family protein [Anaerolineales bacterium]
MFNNDLASAVENFATLLLPLSEKDLEREWIWKDHDEEGIRFAIFVTIQELRQLAVMLASKRGPVTQAQHILGQYHKQYIDLQSALFGLSESQANQIPAENEWSVRQVYAHILGAEINFSAVIRYALEKHRAGNWSPERMSDEDDLRITGMNETKYHALINGSFKDMLTFHRQFHPAIIQEFSTIANNELELPSTFWEDTRFPIRHRLHRYEAHFIQHTVQIDKTLHATNQSPGEAKRLIRYLFAALAEVEANLIGEDNFLRVASSSQKP